MVEVSRIPIIKLYDNLIVSIQTSLSDRLVALLKDDITAKVSQEAGFDIVAVFIRVDWVATIYLSSFRLKINLIANIS